MIIEGIVSTLDSSGQPHFSPMGPVLALAQRRLELRPFRGSTTLANLLACPHGVFHCTDDALLIVQAVIKRWVEAPRVVAAECVPGWVLPAACAWHEFSCNYLDQTGSRATVTAEIRQSGRGPEFAGFNRAKHGLIEAAISLSRLQFLPRAEVELSLQNAARLVEKTGGARERLGLNLLQAYFAEQHASSGEEYPGREPTAGEAVGCEREERSP